MKIIMKLPIREISLRNMITEKIAFIYNEFVEWVLHTNWIVEIRKVYFTLSRLKDKLIVLCAIIASLWDYSSSMRNYLCLWFVVCTTYRHLVTLLLLSCCSETRIHFYVQRDWMWLCLVAICRELLVTPYRFHIMS